MPDSSAIDAGVIALLSADAALMALATDGVHFDEAPANATRFVIVSLADEVDEPQFGGRAYEDALYLVKAVLKDAVAADIKAAAARIDAVLENSMAVVAAGYTCMVAVREARVRYVEVDDLDQSIRWHHRGGHYRVTMSVGT